MKTDYQTVNPLSSIGDNNYESLKFKYGLNFLDITSRSFAGFFVEGEDTVYTDIEHLGAINKWKHTIKNYDINFSFKQEFYEYLKYSAMPINDLQNFVSVIESINISDFDILCNLIVELDHNYDPPLLSKAIKTYLQKD